MSKTVVGSWTGFDSFEHVVVGRAGFACIPPSAPATEAKVPGGGDVWGLWGPRPPVTVEKANARLGPLASMPEERGIT